MTTSEDGRRLPTKARDRKRDRELDKLGREIDELRDMLRHTVVEEWAEIGKRLIAAKRLCPHGLVGCPGCTNVSPPERSSQNYMQMARKFSELQKSNPKQHSDFIRLSYREALKACQEHIDPAPSEPRPGITLLGETTARPGITYPRNLHAPTTETETSDETEDAPQKIVNLVAGPTGEPTEVVQLTSRSSPRAMTLALLDRLHSCLEDARRIWQDDAMPAAIRD